MSVIVETETGWLLDHHANTLCHVPEHSTGNLLTKYQMRQSLFDIVSPFVMDSQFVKSAGHIQSGIIDGCVTIKKRKRKRKEPLNIGELLAEEFHQQIKSHICQAHTSLLQAGTQSGYFLSLDGSQPNDNNMASRSAAAIQGAGDMFAGLFAGTGPDYTQSQLPIRDVSTGLALRSADMLNGVWQHKGKHSGIVHIEDQPFIIPPECTFIFGEMSHLTNGAPVLGTFDLLVLDPPWESKSVKRLKKYNMLGNTELLALPLEQLMSPGCLVVFWVTNRQKHRYFVTRQLFPRKHITHLATWFWLKVTKTGKPVRDIDDKQKRPYEVLLLGRYGDYREPVRHDNGPGRHANNREPCKHDGDNGPGKACNSGDNLDEAPYKEVIKMKANVQSEKDCLQNGSDEKQAKKHCSIEECSLGDEQEEHQTDIGFVTDKQYVEPDEERVVSVIDGHISGSKCLKDTNLHATVGIPDNRVIVSVPCSLHSKKPPLYEVMKRYLPKAARCCEMFARNLQSGWTSWGNEVLIHQHLDYYEPVT